MKKHNPIILYIHPNSVEEEVLIYHWFKNEESYLDFVNTCGSPSDIPDYVLMSGREYEENMPKLCYIMKTMAQHPICPKCGMMIAKNIYNHFFCVICDFTADENPNLKVILSQGCKQKRLLKSFIESCEYEGVMIEDEK